MVQRLILGIKSLLLKNKKVDEKVSYPENLFYLNNSLDNDKELRKKAMIIYTEWKEKLNINDLKRDSYKSTTIDTQKIWNQFISSISNSNSINE